MDMYEVVGVVRIVFRIQKVCLLAVLWDFMDSYYRCNWFLKAYKDRSLTSKD